MNGHPRFHNLWRWKCGLKEELPVTKKVPGLHSLRKTEWSKRFEKMMRDRLIMGALRYGLLHAKGKPQYDRMASAERRIKLYKRTGDIGLLADIANMCLLEFEEGTHPKRHLAEGDGEEKVQVITK